MKILIVGAFGFLGTNIYLELKKNHQVALLVRKNSKPKIYISNKIKRFYIEDKDLCNNLRNELFDFIIDCSVDYGRNTSLENIIQTNVYQPLFLIEEVLKEGAFFIAFDSYFTKKEFSNLKYLEPYINSKKLFKDKAGLLEKKKIITIQLEHLYGPYDSKNKFSNYLYSNLIENKKIKMTQGNQMRDFIYVDDVTRFIVFLIENSLTNPFKLSFFNIGSSKMTSVKEFALKMKKIINSESEINFGAIPFREGEQINYVSHCKKNLMGWTPQIFIDEGIKKMIKINETI